MNESEPISNALPSGFMLINLQNPRQALPCWPAMQGEGREGRLEMEGEGRAPELTVPFP